MAVQVVEGDLLIPLGGGTAAWMRGIMVEEASKSDFRGEVRIVVFKG